MSHIYPARTADISLTTGTGPFSVSGAAPAENMRTFNEVLEVGDTVYLGVVHREEDEWEEGIYTYVGTDRFARTQILQSSNAGSIVDFSAGIKDVFATVPSRTVQRADENVTHTGVTEIDFGSWPGVADASLAVTGQADIAADSFLMAQVVAIETDDHTADEHWVDPPIVVAGEIVEGTGFTIYAQAREDNLYGKYSISWMWKE
jgi:hypothetical protein